MLCLMIEEVVLTKLDHPWLCRFICSLLKSTIHHYLFIFDISKSENSLSSDLMNEGTN